jgi:hypothetical protein
MMKAKLLTIVCAAAVGLSTTPALASIEHDPAAVGTDALIGRPLCFGATVIGAAVFVVTLPFSVPSKSVKSTANSLVVAPGKATFIRPLGDFSYGESQATSGPQFKVRSGTGPK